MDRNVDDGERFARLGVERSRAATILLVGLGMIVVVGAIVEGRAHWVMLALSLVTIGTIVVLARSLRQALVREADCWRELRGLVDQVPVAIIVYEGPSHRIVEMNPAYRRLIGEADIGDREVLDRVFEVGAPMRITDLEVGGRVLTTAFHPRRGADGATIGVIGIGVEVTERVRVEHELRGAVAAREDVLSIAAHELQTPVTALLLQLESLADMPAHRATEKLQASIRHASQLGRMIEGLLDVSRASAGRLQLEPEEFDLAEAARDLADQLRDTARRNGCVILVDAAHAVGRWDRSRIEQVLTNLLSNAIKYGAGHPVEVTVRPEGDRVRLVVHDDGIGIPVEESARVFGRFERTGAARNYGGLGLGLYIARQIVEAHHGWIAVASEPGHGATFTVDLPRHGQGTTAQTGPAL